MINKDYLKQTWLYKHCRGFFMWPKDLAHKLPLKRKYFWMTYQKNWMIDPCTGKRQKYWEKCGVHATGKFNVGADVYFDAQNANYLTIEDEVWISSCCIILLHKRDISNYYKGDRYRSQPTSVYPVKICKGAAIGMGTIIMPGVTIGEGAVIGSGSLVTKDIPAWSVAVGRPARVVKELKTREDIELLKSNFLIE
jgi:acetyltransferase-like isoleucine patch superfamily enzyme